MESKIWFGDDLGLEPDGISILLTTATHVLTTDDNVDARRKHPIYPGIHDNRALVDPLEKRKRRFEYHHDHHATADLGKAIIHREIM